MKIIEPSVKILTPIDGNMILKHLEECGRTCYQSHDSAGEGSAEKLIRQIIKSGHESVLEHFLITVKLKTDVGAYKDITRHRLASFSIESTRWCNYSKGKFGTELKFMKPCNIEGELYEDWLKAMEYIEKMYMQMAEKGAAPDQLRMILPHSTAAEVCMSANLREWRHIFRLRTAKAAHPSVQQIMKMVLAEFKAKIPVIFDDIGE